MRPRRSWNRKAPRRRSEEATGASLVATYAEATLRERPRKKVLGCGEAVSRPKTRKDAEEALEAGRDWRPLPGEAQDAAPGMRSTSSGTPRSPTCSRRREIQQVQLDGPTTRQLPAQPARDCCMTPHRGRQARLRGNEASQSVLRTHPRLDRWTQLPAPLAPRSAALPRRAIARRFHARPHAERLRALRHLSRRSSRGTTTRGCPRTTTRCGRRWRRRGRPWMKEYDWRSTSSTIRCIPESRGGGLLPLPPERAGHPKAATLDQGKVGQLGCWSTTR